MDNPVFSLIIPVYNTELEIERCMNSILNQTYNNFELLCIDDGSTDHSLSICRQFAQNDRRIQVFSQSNAGVSAARNLGLKHANGDYTLFIDSDDWIEQRTLLLINEKLDKYKPDILVFGICKDFYEKDALVKSEIKSCGELRFFVNEQIDENWRYMLNTLDMESSCNKVFKRSVVEKHQIRFDEQMIVFEDFNFVLDYLSKVEYGICLLPESLYHYCFPLLVSPSQRRKKLNLVNDVSTVVKKTNDYSHGKIHGITATNEIAHYKLNKYSLVFAKIKEAAVWKEAKPILQSLITDEIFQQNIDNFCLLSGYYRLIIKLLQYKAFWLAYTIIKFR